MTTAEQGGEAGPDTTQPLGAASPELRAAPPWVMEEMIAAEPGLVEPILRAAQGSRLSERLGPALDRRDPVVVTGCGTSEHAAMAVAEMVTAAAGHRSAAVSARQALEAAAEPLEGGVCIAVSHEGQTGATVAAMRAARAAGATTALITAAPRSEAAAVADHVLATPVVDRSWCHTVGYLSPVLAGGGVAAMLDGSPQDAEGLRQYLERVLRLRAAAARVAGALHGVRHLLVAGSGVDRVAARELALKVEEGVRLPTVGRDLETVMHGHLVAHGPSTGLVVVASDPRSRAERAERATQLLRAAGRIGLRTAAIVSEPVAAEWDDEGLTSAGRVELPQAGQGEALLPWLAATGIALQILTLELTHSAGTNPDLIRREEDAYREAAEIAESSFPA